MGLRSRRPHNHIYSVSEAATVPTAAFLVPLPTSPTADVPLMQPPRGQTVTHDRRDYAVATENRTALDDTLHRRHH